MRVIEWRNMVLLTGSYTHLLIWIKTTKDLLTIWQSNPSSFALNRGFYTPKKKNQRAWEANTFLLFEPRQFSLVSRPHIFQEADVSGSTSSEAEKPFVPCSPSTSLFCCGGSECFCNPAPSLLLCSEIFV